MNFWFIGTLARSAADTASVDSSVFPPASRGEKRGPPHSRCYPSFPVGSELCSGGRHLASSRPACIGEMLLRFCRMRTIFLRCAHPPPPLVAPRMRCVEGVHQQAIYCIGCFKQDEFREKAPFCSPHSSSRPRENFHALSCLYEHCSQSSVST